jgi:hypothetical protein
MLNSISSSFARSAHQLDEFAEQMFPEYDIA